MARSEPLQDSMKLIELYKSIRHTTIGLVDGLSDADATVQPMEDASPAKWHLAHTSWFFETFILKEYIPQYKCFDTNYNYLFNSYYEAVGARHARPLRGMLTRPRLEEIMAYRDYVDAKMYSLLAGQVSESVSDLVLLGLNHEEQHQELLLTDILYLFSLNPLKPALRPQKYTAPAPETQTIAWHRFEEQLAHIGGKGDGFHFDCELPRHQTYLQAFEIADRAVTNAEWINFIEDGGYDDPSFWLSDGWAWRQQEGWEAPLYWEKRDHEWRRMTLHGMQPVIGHEPVVHVGYYEADAFASWAQARLPREEEWELAALSVDVKGHLLNHDYLTPQPQIGNGLKAMYGDVWEWTRSAFLPYPRYEPTMGAIGEYNGKFMSGQMVLRGGSCVTPARHIRPEYRNFFHPNKRWQFSGLRLARDC